jgi:hypothetical protein
MRETAMNTLRRSRTANKNINSKLAHIQMQDNDKRPNTKFTLQLSLVTKKLIPRVEDMEIHPRFPLRCTYTTNRRKTGQRRVIQRVRKISAIQNINFSHYFTVNIHSL